MNKYYFWRNISVTLIMIFSVFSGFSGNMNFNKFNPFLAIQSFVLLSLVLLIMQLPDLISALLKKRGERHEWYKIYASIFLRVYNSNGSFGFYFPSYWRRGFFNVCYYSHPIFIHICLLLFQNKDKKLSHYR